MIYRSNCSTRRPEKPTIRSARNLQMFLALNFWRPPEFNFSIATPATPALHHPPPHSHPTSGRVNVPTNFLRCVYLYMCMHVWITRAGNVSLKYYARGGGPRRRAMLSVRDDSLSGGGKMRVEGITQASSASDFYPNSIKVPRSGGRKSSLSGRCTCSPEGRHWTITLNLWGCKKSLELPDLSRLRANTMIRENWGKSGDEVFRMGFRGSRRTRCWTLGFEFQLEFARAVLVYNLVYANILVTVVILMMYKLRLSRSFRWSVHLIRAVNVRVRISIGIRSCGVRVIWREQISLQLL